MNIFSLNSVKKIPKDTSFLYSDLVTDLKCEIIYYAYFTLLKK